MSTYRQLYIPYVKSESLTVNTITNEGSYSYLPLTPGNAGDTLIMNDQSKLIWQPYQSTGKNYVSTVDKKIIYGNNNFCSLPSGAIASDLSIVNENYIVIITPISNSKFTVGLTDTTSTQSSSLGHIFSQCFTEGGEGQPVFGTIIDGIFTQNNESSFSYMTQDMEQYTIVIDPPLAQINDETYALKCSQYTSSQFHEKYDNVIFFYNDTQVFGNNNELVNGKSTVVGDGNKTNYHHATIYGCDNVSSGYESKIIGNNNNVSGNGNTIIGKSNEILNCEYTSIKGEKNEVKGNYWGGIAGGFNRPITTKITDAPLISLAESENLLDVQNPPPYVILNNVKMIVESSGDGAVTLSCNELNLDRLLSADNPKIYYDHTTGIIRDIRANFTSSNNLSFRKDPGGQIIDANYIQIIGGKLQFSTGTPLQQGDIIYMGAYVLNPGYVRDSIKIDGSSNTVEVSSNVDIRGDFNEVKGPTKECIINGSLNNVSNCKKTIIFGNENEVDGGSENICIFNSDNLSIRDGKRITVFNAYREDSFPDNTVSVNGLHNRGATVVVPVLENNISGESFSFTIKDNVSFAYINIQPQDNTPKTYNINIESVSNDIGRSITFIPNFDYDQAVASEIIFTFPTSCEKILYKPIVNSVTSSRYISTDNNQIRLTNPNDPSFSNTFKFMKLDGATWLIDGVAYFVPIIG